MTEDFGRADAIRRGAHALIQSLGATCVELRIPLPPLANDDGEELGLRTPAFRSQLLAPVAIRVSNHGTVIVVSADVLQDALGLQSTEALRESVAMASSIGIDDESYVVLGTEAVRVGGGACFYRLLLQLMDEEEV